MTASRLSTFGRWTFFAGLVYAFTLVGIGRVVDWPDWLGAAVSAAGGLLAFRLIDRLADRSVVAGRCGIAAPVTTWMSHAPRPVCALPHGHAGWHRADDGCEWGQIRTEESA